MSENEQSLFDDGSEEEQKEDFSDIEHLIMQDRFNGNIHFTQTKLISLTELLQEYIPSRIHRNTVGSIKNKYNDSHGTPAVSRSDHKILMNIAKKYKDSIEVESEENNNDNAEKVKEAISQAKKLEKAAEQKANVFRERRMEGNVKWVDSLT